MDACRDLFGIGEVQMFIHLTPLTGYDMFYILREKDVEMVIQKLRVHARPRACEGLKTGVKGVKGVKLLLSGGHKKTHCRSRRRTPTRSASWLAVIQTSCCQPFPYHFYFVCKYTKK